MNTALLFRSDAKRRFMQITGQRYDAMKVRLAKKKLPMVFTKQALRDHIFAQMGWNYGGAIRCRYCGQVCGIEEVQFDHAEPLVRGGSLLLINIELPCARCNAIKGEMLPSEYRELREFLESASMMCASVDIYHRLATHGKLMSSKRQAEMLARGVQPKPKHAKPALIAWIDKSF